MFKNTKLGRNADYEDETAVSSFRVSYIPERIGTIVIDILSGIECAEQFAQGIQALEASDENNPVQINLQCPGGSLGAADHFIHAMRKCKGHIHTIATGSVSSAATFILLESDSFELSENFHALLHCGSLGNIGNFNEYQAKAEFDARFMKTILTNTYSGFLSEEEIKDLLKGGDIWLDAEQWVTRFQARNEYLTELREMSEVNAVEELLKKPANKRKKKTKEID